MNLWQSQWELFAPNFRDGKAHVSLNSTTTLQLLPGPGFGDFSHPTTQLTLKLATPLFPHHPVIDIGCGSGILSLAATALGAKSAYGYDIDPDAVLHATQNGLLNHSSATFSNAPPPKIRPHSLILMNMISSEQSSAWNTFLPSLTTPATLITSGVLDKEVYLAWAQPQAWHLTESLQQDSWWAFKFIIY